MRDYEIVYIFDTALSEDDVETKLDRFHDAVTGGSGEITAVDHWGKRQMAYPIAKHDSGYYVVTQFRTQPDHLPELERLLKLDDDLLRHLIVIDEGYPTAPMSESTREDVDLEADDEDDEDEDEDDEDEDEES